MMEVSVWRVLTVHCFWICLSLFIVGFCFRDCEDEDIQFDADSFMDTVGSLLGEANKKKSQQNTAFTSSR